MSWFYTSLTGLNQLKTSPHGRNEFERRFQDDPVIIAAVVVRLLNAQLLDFYTKKSGTDRLLPSVHAPVFIVGNGRRGQGFSVLSVCRAGGFPLGHALSPGRAK